MNKFRRKELDDVIAKIYGLSEKLELIMSEEEGCRDNMPENLWSTERYEQMENACNSIQMALDSFEEAVSYIESAQE